jgi:hypothetical protein
VVSGRLNVEALLNAIHPFLHIMLSLSASTTSSKHVSHAKLELAGLLT